MKKWGAFLLAGTLLGSTAACNIARVDSVIQARTRSAGTTAQAKTTPPSPPVTQRPVQPNPNNPYPQAGGYNSPPPGYGSYNAYPPANSHNSYNNSNSYQAPSGYPATGYGNPYPPNHYGQPYDPYKPQKRQY